MSSEYQGKTDAQIIEEQAMSLNAKSDNQDPTEKFQPRNTVLSEQSGVNESGVGGFAGAQVNVGRTGQTGGGTNPQIIPAEEGGDARSQRPGETSERFEGAMGGQEQRIKEVSLSRAFLCPVRRCLIPQTYNYLSPPFLLFPLVYSTLHLTSPCCSPVSRLIQALTSNPGANTATEARQEPVPPTEGQQLEVDQEGTARQYAFNS